jgi:uncharacterized membrane protein
MTRRKFILLALLAATLCAAVGLAYGRFSQARDQAVAAVADLEDCARCAEKIESCRNRPNLASDHQKLDAETNGIVERAAKGAGVDTQRLLRISPEPPQRFLDTAYKEKPTQVVLKDVTLQQLVTILYNLTGEHGLAAKSLRISAPQAEDATGQWSAELVVTYLIYDPQRPEK